MAQLFEPRGCHPELSAENLRVMLPQRRRRYPNLARRPRKLDWRAGILVSARDRLSNLDKKIARLQMLRVQQVGHRRDRGKRHPPCLCLAVEVEHALLADPFLEEYFERVPVLRALGPVRKNFSIRPLRVAHDFDEAPPVMLEDATQ